MRYPENAGALAGADADWGSGKATSDGLLFASEVLTLDLRSTELVTLSSCQSALGDIQPGDGAQGLRRAFNTENPLDSTGRKPA